MRKNTVVLVTLFCLMWYFNFCTPLICDDYVYSFVWQDNSMGAVLTEPVKRINGFTDIIYSQWKHYFSWGGRLVAHFFAQLFLWLGKDLFNFLNAGCFLLLLLEMQWIVNAGKISFNFPSNDILWLFGAVWIFGIYLGIVFSWLTLSCNYLWTTVILLAFLLVYERHYFYTGGKLLKNNYFYFTLFFIFGVFAGWTNENVPCFVILVLGLYLYKAYKEQKEINLFLLVGLLGMVLGYILLVSAPGNFVRYARQLQDNIVASGTDLMKENLITLANILLIRLILIYYVLRNLIIIYKAETSELSRKLLNISSAFLFLSLASSMIMLFSPFFKYRSSFPGLIFLVIAAGIVRRVKKLEEKCKMHITERAENSVERKASTALHFIGIIYICVTLTASLYIGTLQYQQTQNMLSRIRSAKQISSNRVLTVREQPKLIEKYFFETFLISGGHLMFAKSLTSDENCWINRDIALYYGISAIRSGEEEELP